MVKGGLTGPLPKAPTMRSLLLVSDLTPETFEQARGSGADALVLDMGEGSASLTTQHELIGRLLPALQEDENRPLIYIRLGPIDADTIDADLMVLMRSEPDGFVLRDCRSGMDVQQLAAKLAVHEAEYDLADGQTAVIAEAGTSAGSLFSMGSYRGASARLLGLAWDAGALAQDLGAEMIREADGRLIHPLALARSLTLIGARAADVAAIDGVGDGGADAGAFRAACEEARRDGFNAKIAMTPEEVQIINDVFDRDV